MYNLKIIIASTRPARKGPAVASWIHRLAAAHSAFSTELLDLAALNLPLMDEPEHPRLQKYQHEHTRNWSRMIDVADAFIFVTPEYNHSYPAPLKNALDFLFKEWAYKPVGLVSYGGIAAGTRAAQALKPVLNALKLIPLTEAVTIPFFTKLIDDTGQFNATEELEKSAAGMLNALEKWAEALSVLRTANP